MIKKHFVIGLTGTFGSGKTSVAKEFKSLGCYVIDCDEIVRNLYKNGGSFLKKVNRLIGLEQFDRKAAAQIVFSSSHKRKALERLVHPLVFQEVEKRIKKSGKRTVVIEMPLLFEAGFQRKTDFSVVVAATGSMIRNRLFKKGFSESEIKKRQNAQWPLRKKIRKADFIILNNGSKQTLRKQVKTILIKIQNSNHLINDSKRRA